MQLNAAHARMSLDRAQFSVRNRAACSRGLQRWGTILLHWPFAQFIQPLEKLDCAQAALDLPQHPAWAFAAVTPMLTTENLLEG
jgi:hypothetical protein